jgi:hypothetical protein
MRFGIIAAARQRFPVLTILRGARWGGAGSWSPRVRYLGQRVNAVEAQATRSEHSPRS